MSLAARVAGKTEAKMLIIDIERFKGLAQVEFWDLGDYRHRRIHADSVIEWPRTICFAALWYDKKRPEFYSEWDHGQEGMLRAAHRLYSEADIVVGHNLASFDTKKLKAGWLELGLTPPRPWRTIDTLTIARSEFGFESNTLDALCKRLGLAGKNDHYDPEVARRALAGDRKAQKLLQSYNENDTRITRGLKDRMRPWIRNHPNLTLWMGDDERACPNCASERIVQDGSVTTGVTKFAAFRCEDCGAWSRANHRKAHAAFRPVAR